MLASPFQRPMRYRLLFEELLKYTLPDEPDRKKRFGLNLDAPLLAAKEQFDAVPHPTRPGIVAALNAVGELHFFCLLQFFCLLLFFCLLIYSFVCAPPRSSPRPSV